MILGITGLRYPVLSPTRSPTVLEILRQLPSDVQFVTKSISTLAGVNSPSIGGALPLPRTNRGFWGSRDKGDGAVRGADSELRQDMTCVRARAEHWPSRPVYD